MRLRLSIALALAVGALIGLGSFTFVYAKGYSYLRNDPAVCANCHVTAEHYAAWQKGSHRSVATCNDCHTPHDVVGKYTVKAKNGFWQAAAADGSASAADLERSRDYHRQAQFMADFVEAENSMGFHAPQEAMRVLGHSLNLARLGMTAVLQGG